MSRQLDPRIQHEQIRIQILGGNAPSPRHWRHRQVIGVLIDYVIPQFAAQQGPYVLLVVDSPEVVPAQVPAHVSTCREPAAWPASIAFILQPIARCPRDSKITV